jgi:hypothetical protein
MIIALFFLFPKPTGGNPWAFHTSYELLQSPAARHTLGREDYRIGSGHSNGSGRDVNRRFGI